MSILIFLLVLFVLVLVHEWGHFIVAKWTNMRVDEFGIGFPPKLFGIQKGETEYTFNLFPIGGFVKIFGEDAVGVSEEPDSDRSFVAKSKWAQAAVLLAGVTMNVLFAWLLFTVALGLGVQTAVDEANASSEAELVVRSTLPGSPAETAGIPQGAVITRVQRGSTELEGAGLTPSAFSALIEDSHEESVSLTYAIGGNEVTVPVTASGGLVPNEPERLAIGVELMLVEIVSRPLHIAAAESLMLTLTSLRDITTGILGLLYDAVRFEADLSGVAGPVGIVGLVGDASAVGLTYFLMFTAFISLNLAVINLIPVPALDGGRLLFVAIEAIKGSPIRPTYVHALNTVGFALLILLMIAVTFNDIARIL